MKNNKFEIAKIHDRAWKNLSNQRIVVKIETIDTNNKLFRNINYLIKNIEIFLLYLHSAYVNVLVNETNYENVIINGKTVY